MHLDSGLRGLGGRFWLLAKPYWSSEERWSARGRLGLLLLLLLAETRCNVLFNEQSGELTSALAALDRERFWASIRLFAVLVVVAIPIYGYYYFVRDTLAIAWRRWLTERVTRGYLRDHTYYELNANAALDNPDQRITEDISSFTQKSLTFVMLMASATLQLIAFSGVLWGISRLLVGFLLGYAALGTVVTFGGFGKRLVRLNVQQLRREADLRFGLVRVRENAEAIAFYRGEEREAVTLSARLAALVQNFTKLIRWTLGLNLFQRGYGLMALVLPSIVVAPGVLRGELEVGAVVRASGAFAAILAALNVFVDNFENLSKFAAGIERLTRFVQFIERDEDGRTQAQGRVTFETGTELRLEHLTLQTPNRERTLVRNLSLRVETGKGLLIVGVSGGGKSSLLRVIGGLWHAGSGTVTRPPLPDMLFVPQHPYMLLGSLRSQLLYPGVTRDVSDEEFQDVLRRVNLPHLVEQCGSLDAELDFGKVLSTGEQQRLSFARVLLMRPRFVLLDEATSALDPENEARLYAELKALGATWVSVSHHPATLAYHDTVLELSGNGAWQLKPAAGYVFDGAFAVA